jgi:hypothetical protein
MFEKKRGREVEIGEDSESKEIADRMFETAKKNVKEGKGDQEMP